MRGARRLRTAAAAAAAAVLQGISAIHAVEELVSKTDMVSVLQQSGHGVNAESVLLLIFLYYYIIPGHHTPLSRTGGCLNDVTGAQQATAEQQHQQQQLV